MSYMCNSCKHKNTVVCIHCKSCERYEKKREEMQTNADRIRGMTDEELTRFFAENCGCDDWCMHKRSGACASKSENECCLDVWYNWLKSPAEVDE